MPLTSAQMAACTSQPFGPRPTQLVEAAALEVPDRPMVAALFRTDSRRTGRRIIVLDGESVVYDTDDCYDLGNATNKLDLWLTSLVAPEPKKPTMLRLDGEIWEIAPGEGDDATTIKARVARPKKDHPEGAHDQKAIDAGITHVQTTYGGDLYHEVRRIK